MLIKGTEARTYMLKAQFLICNSCFWCASTLTDCFAVSKCPSCGSNGVETIPIASNETYKFNYSAKDGVTLEFA